MVPVGIIFIMFHCTLKNCVSEVVSWVRVGTALGHSTPGKVPGKHGLKLKLMEFWHCWRWSQASNSSVKEALFLPPPPVMLHAPAACLVYPVPITNIARQTLLPESSIIVIPSERSWEPGCSAPLSAASAAARALSPASQQLRATPRCLPHAACLRSGRLILSWPFRVLKP